MTAGVPSGVARTHRRLIGLPQPSRSLRQTSLGLHQTFQGFIQPFSSFPQPLPEAYQSLKDAENPINTPFLPQNGVFQRLVGLTCRSAQISGRRSNAALPKFSQLSTLN
jgi:hypothetical protein